MPKYKHRQCEFTKDKINYIDYKALDILERYTSQYWKIVPSYYSGTSIKAQKMLAKAVKRARQMALVPYTKQ